MAWHGLPFDPIAAASRLQPQILERLRWHRLGSAAAPSTMGRSAHSCPRAAALQNDLLEDREREPVRASATVVCVRARVGARARVLHLIFGIESNRRAASAARSFKYSSTAARTRATCAPTCDIGRRRQQVRCWPAAVAWRPSDAACCATPPHVAMPHAPTPPTDRRRRPRRPSTSPPRPSAPLPARACVRVTASARVRACLSACVGLAAWPLSPTCRLSRAMMSFGSTSSLTVTCRKRLPCSVRYCEHCPVRYCEHCSVGYGEDCSVRYCEYCTHLVLDHRHALREAARANRLVQVLHLGGHRRDHNLPTNGHSVTARLTP